MEAVREMDAATTKERRETTAAAGTEVTTETIGIQATETTTPADDSNSNCGGAILSPDNP